MCDVISFKASSAAGARLRLIHVAAKPSKRPTRLGCCGPMPKDPLLLLPSSFLFVLRALLMRQFMEFRSLTAPLLHLTVFPASWNVHSQEQTREPCFCAQNGEMCHLEMGEADLAFSRGAFPQGDVTSDRLSPSRDSSESALFSWPRRPVFHGSRPHSA